MATTYRARIDDGDFRKRDLLHFRWTATVKRDSASTERTMIERFIEALSGTVPHEGATAHLESSGPRGLRIIVRAEGMTTAWRRGRDGHSRVPDGGEWRTPEGELLAVAGAPAEEGLRRNARGADLLRNATRPPDDESPITNLPDWPGASRSYSYLYAVLDELGRENYERERAAAKRARRKPRPPIPTEQVREIIDALARGDEESVKGLAMEYRTAAFRRNARALPPPKDRRIQCPFCGVRSWSTDYAAFMRDHDRPDGRRCIKAAQSYKA